MTVSPIDTHATDAALIRWIDGEADAAEQAWITAHTSECASCAARREQLRRRSTNLSALLHATAPFVPEWVSPEQTRRADVIPIGEARAHRVRTLERLGGTSWLRTAAGILLVLGLGFSVTPVRAWVTEWVSRGWSEIVAVLGESGQAPVAESDPGRNRLRFTPTTDRLLLQVAERPGRGTLYLQSHDAAEVVVEVIGGEDENLFVLPGKLRIENSSGSSADFRVTLPSALREIEVQIGDRTVAAFTPAQLERTGVTEIRLPDGE